MDRLGGLKVIRNIFKTFSLLPEFCVFFFGLGFAPGVLKFHDDTQKQMGNLLLSPSLGANDPFQSGNRCVSLWGK